MTKFEKIQEAALRLFTEDGFDATPTSRIAKEAGVATGTLFHHFSSKDELINALYIAVKERMIERIARGVTADQSLRDRLRQVWVNSISWGLDFPAEYRFFRQYSGSRYINDKAKEEGEAYLQFLFDLLQEGADNGVLKSTDASFLYAIGSGLVMEVIQYLLTRGKPENQDAIWETGWRSFWDALRAREA